MIESGTLVRDGHPDDPVRFDACMRAPTPLGTLSSMEAREASASRSWVQPATRLTHGTSVTPQDRANNRKYNYY